MNADLAAIVGFVVLFLKTIPSALVFAIPFTFGGIIIGFLLSSPDFPPRRVYFFDLIGSAAGACLILPILSVVGVERSVAVQIDEHRIFR